MADDREMKPEENDLNLAALDALANFVGRHDERSIARLLRSEYPIHPMVRRHLASALESGRLRLFHQRAGKPVTIAGAMERSLKRVEIGSYILDRIGPKCPQKAAVADACEHFNISDRTAKIALRAARQWRQEIEDLRKPIPE